MVRQYPCLLVVLSLSILFPLQACTNGTNGERASQTATGPEQVLYAFQGGNNGLSPSGGLIFDSSGNLYGMTGFGGAGTCKGNNFSGCGTVFELKSNGSGGWTETVLYSFQGGSDGEEPSGGLIFDQAGNLYGTTTAGGGQSACTNGCGTVFRLALNGSGGWVETVLYSFGTNGGASDGAQPQRVIFDKSGNLFGTTLSGGIFGCNGGFIYCGTVFELSPNGSGGWTETLPSLLNFPGGGTLPNPGLTADQSGNLYGTTNEGGGSTNCRFGCGTVFELSPNGSGGWTGRTLYSFQGQSDGALPFAGMVVDQSGNFYGTTRNGGGGNTVNCATAEGDGCGTVYKLSPNGSGGWTETTLYAFQGGNDGGAPTDPVILDQSGNLFSTTRYGGGSAKCAAGSLFCGAVFELSPNGSGGWTESVLYGFQGGNDGDFDNSSTGGVIRDQAGNLYGTTSSGGGTGCGGFGCGTVYEVLSQ